MSQSIKVVCAILEHENKVLVTQRSEHMPQALLWEFPGGKLEQHETEEIALVRELQEELSITVEPVQRLSPVSHPYPDKLIELIPFRCIFKGGEISLHEHRAYQWAQATELLTYAWCPADIPVVEEYLLLKKD